jgi:hypothetical protein
LCASSSSLGGLTRADAEDGGKKKKASRKGSASSAEPRAPGASDSATVRSWVDRICSRLGLRDQGQAAAAGATPITSPGLAGPKRGLPARAEPKGADEKAADDEDAPLRLERQYSTSVSAREAYSRPPMAGGSEAVLPGTHPGNSQPLTCN